MNIYDDTKNLMMYKYLGSGDYDLLLSPIGTTQYKSINYYPEYKQPQVNGFSKHIRTIGYLVTKHQYQMVSKADTSSNNM